MILTGSPWLSGRQKQTAHFFNKEGHGESTDTGDTPTTNKLLSVTVNVS